MMTFLKSLAAICAVTTLFVTNAMAQAPTSVLLASNTYYFYSSTSDQSFDGSTITFTGSRLTAYNIVDTANPRLNITSPQTNIFVSGVYTDANDWVVKLGPVPFSGYELIDSSINGASSLTVYSSQSPAVDPPGTWSLTPLAAPVPETSATLPLLGIGLAALIFGKRFIRVSKAA